MTRLWEPGEPVLPPRLPAETLSGRQPGGGGRVHGPALPAAQRSHWGGRVGGGEQMLSVALWHRGGNQGTER